MANFCAQCTKDMLGPDYTEEGNCNDLEGITTEEEWKQGKAALVICEGCGVIQVDPQGQCVSIGCLENHNTEDQHIPWYPAST